MARTPFATWTWSEHDGRDAEQAVTEIERELQVRQRCYDRWIAEGKLTHVDATDRQERLLAARKFIIAAMEQEQETTEPVTPF
jgi:hypothetical protein